MIKTYYLAGVLLGLILSCTSDKTMTLTIPMDTPGVKEITLVRPSYKADGKCTNDTLAQAPVSDGKAIIRWEVDEPCYVNVLWNGSKERIEIIAEPGNLSMERTTSGSLIARGTLNNKIIHSVYNDTLYTNAESAADQFCASCDFEKLTDIEKEEFQKKVRRLYQKTFMIREKIYENLYEKASPREQLLILVREKFDMADYREKLHQLEKELGPGYTLTLLNTQMAEEEKRKKELESIAIGKPFKDFNTKTLNNEEIKLSDIIKKNRYTLLEFWASWCGPCRGEIPYLKKDYEKFHQKGFEIFSYSLDSDENNWKTASKEEGIKWINTSDLKAWDAPAAGLYYVRGVPANFLIDQKGTIIAQDLRGLNLMRKLNELFQTK